jgi:hypothetical protein
MQPDSNIISSTAFCKVNAYSVTFFYEAQFSQLREVSQVSHWAFLMFMVQMAEPKTKDVFLLHVVHASE